MCDKNLLAKYYDWMIYVMRVVLTYQSWYFQRTVVKLL